MSLYIVRVTKTKEAVGILAADSLDILRDLVDELCDPNGCDYRRVKSGGGVFFKNRCPSLPRVWTDDGGAHDPASEDYVDLERHISEFTESLTYALAGADGKGEKCWKSLSPQDATWVPGLGDVSDERMTDETPGGLSLRCVAKQFGLDAPGPEPSDDEVRERMERVHADRKPLAVPGDTLPAA